MVSKIHGLLGLSAKAGKVMSGTDIVLEGIVKKKVKLLVIASDASAKTIKNMEFTCEKYNIELIVFGTIDDNSRAIGKENRAVIGVTDDNLAQAILKQFHGGV